MIVLNVKVNGTKIIFNYKHEKHKIVIVKTTFI